MKCKNYFFSLFVALLGVFFGSCIINQNNTYAVDDISITLTDLGSGGSLCSQPDCSNYHYLLISIGSFSTPPVVGSRAYVSLGSDLVCTNVPLYTSFTLCELNSEINNSIWGLNYAFNNLAGRGGSVTFTLSENNPFASGITPSGSIELTENGTYDVSQYAEAVVNVPETDCPPSSGGGGNYHEDLVAINNSILICAAVCLVIYFFYCIYRMIIKNSGVK